MAPHDWANDDSVDNVFGMVSKVLVPWDMVLFYGMGVKFKGKIMLHYSRRVK